MDKLFPDRDLHDPAGTVRSRKTPPPGVNRTTGYAGGGLVRWPGFRAGGQDQGTRATMGSHQGPAPFAPAARMRMLMKLPGYGPKQRSWLSPIPFQLRRSPGWIVIRTAEMVRFSSSRKTGLPFFPPHWTSPRQVSFRAPIWSINVKSAFSDDNSASESEYVDISVVGFNIWNDLEVDGTHANAPTSYEWFSQGLSGNISILNLRVCRPFALGG